jgi:hypothetical protein
MLLTLPEAGESHLSSLHMRDGHKGHASRLISRGRQRSSKPFRTKRPHLIAHSR